MPKRYHPKVYPQARKGSGFRWISPKGKEISCAGLEWYVDYRDASGERTRIKAHPGLCKCKPRKCGACTHEMAAQDLLVEVLSPQPLSVEVPQESSDPRCCIDEFITLQLEELQKSRQHSKGTQINKRTSLVEFRAFCERRRIVDLRDLDRQLIEAFRDELSIRTIAKTGARWKGNNVNRYLRDVRALLNRAVRLNLIVTNPARSMGRGDDLFLPTTDSRPVTVLTDQEVAWLLQLKPEDISDRFLLNAHHLLDMIRLFYMCGLRLGELCNLTFAQVRRGVIHIEPHDGWLPKWGIRRSIPMCDEVKQIIDTRREAAGRSGKYVFVTASGTPFGERNVGRMVAELFKAYGIRGDSGTGVSTHSLRHTFCTTCLMANIPITLVMNWMGHRNVETTLKYWHKVTAKSDQMIYDVKFNVTSISPPALQIALLTPAFEPCNNESHYIERRIVHHGQSKPPGTTLETRHRERRSTT